MSVTGALAAAATESRGRHRSTLVRFANTTDKRREAVVDMNSQPRPPPIQWDLGKSCARAKLARSTQVLLGKRHTHQHGRLQYAPSIPNDLACDKGGPVYFSWQAGEVVGNIQLPSAC